MQSNQQQKINVDNFEAQMPRPMPCPVPVVVKGGEDEFVLSHLGSVEVKAVAGIGSILGGGGGSGSVGGRRIAMNLPTTATRGLQPNSGSFSPASASSSYNNKTGDDNDVEFEKNEEKEKLMIDTTNKGKNENGANQEDAILYDELI